MEFRVLGPLEVLGADGPVAIGGTKQRALLAVLLVHANSVVSADRLVDVLWGDAPPEDAAGALRTCASRLRGALDTRESAGQMLVTQAPGHVLRVGSDQMDASRFEGLVTESTFRPSVSHSLTGPVTDLTLHPRSNPELSRGD